MVRVGGCFGAALVTRQRAHSFPLFCYKFLFPYHKAISFFSHPNSVFISSFFISNQQEGEVPGEDVGDWAEDGEDEVRETKNEREGRRVDLRKESKREIIHGG